MCTPLKKWEFNELKQSVLNLIANSSQRIKSDTSIHKSGIYLLYVDDFSDKKVIPFYIGKTNDFQKRFQMHLKDIKGLMQHSCVEYQNKLLLSAVTNKKAFEGKYRPCKIFKYLIDHNCTIDDVKMVVIETCDLKVLAEKEWYYLSTFLPAFFGFNQIATITEQWQYRDNPQLKKSILKSDLCNFLNYLEYGYSTFNYLHSFSHYGNDELKEKVSLLLSNHFWLSKNELLNALLTSFDNYQKIFENVYKKMENSFAALLHSVFCEYKFNSKIREMEVLSMFINPYHIPIVMDNNSTLHYLEYYFNRDNRCKYCGNSIKELYLKNKNKIDLISSPARNAFENFLQIKKQIIEQSEYFLIFPQKPF